MPSALKPAALRLWAYISRAHVTTITVYTRIYMLWSTGLSVVMRHNCGDEA